MNLADPELELIDPTPNIHTLFIHFDKLFFWTKLASRAVVRWSKRMYSCAGICSYEGRGGLCDIAISEPLLKLRPRKDLVETLLHEMIHAFLFVTCRDQDRDGHGPNFKSHMYRINKLAGVNISIYHDFHDEVQLYQTHWWRCNGPCQTRKPYFGIVRRSANRAPGPNDYWWKTHQKMCGGSFIKIKGPDKVANKKTSKPNTDITKYVKNSNSNIVINKKILNDNKKSTIDVVKNNGNETKNNLKNNQNNTLVITQNRNTFSPNANKKTLPASNSKVQIDNGRRRTQSTNVIETVRNVWANKQLPTVQNVKRNISKDSNDTASIYSANDDTTKSNKHKSKNIHADSPPCKRKKIDEYFKKVATTVLKDIYGEDFTISQSKTDSKLIVTSKVNLVDCPICNIKVNDADINRHLDECLNKGVVATLCKDSKPIDTIPTVIPSNNVDETKLKETVGVPTRIPWLKQKTASDVGKNCRNVPQVTNIKIERFDDSIDISDISYIRKEPSDPPDDTATQNRNNLVNNKVIDTTNSSFDEKDVNTVKLITKKINYDNHLRRSGKFVETASTRQTNVDFGYLPSFLDDLACEIKLPAVKIESASAVQKCPCCGKVTDKPIELHLDECLAFFDNGTTIPEEGASTSYANETIVIDEGDDIFDETQTLNATGTKCPCPCCLRMFEQVEMNYHLDICLK